MKIILEIPKEFEKDFEIDRFEDSLCRLIADAHSIAGNYEKEVAEMLIDAFRNGTSLPKGHGRLIDAERYRKEMLDRGGFDFFSTLYMQPTIIGADEELDNG